MAWISRRAARWVSLSRFIVHVVKRDGIGVLTMDSPPVNSLGVDLLKDFAEGVRTLEADPAVQGLLLTSRGKVFSSGKVPCLHPSFHGLHLHPYFKDWI